MHGWICSAEITTTLNGAGDHARELIPITNRLLGSRHLHAERAGIYRVMASRVLCGVRRPVLLIDWADFELKREWLMLKAAVPVQGRALTVFEKAYPFSRYNSPGAHQEFLRELKAILPEGCRPILVTDAGFRGPWFRAVSSHGWDWVGRIRNGIKFYDETRQKWSYTDSLYEAATPRVKHLGEVSLSRRRKYRCRLYLLRAYAPKRRNKRRRTTRCQRNAGQYRRLHQRAWLLATSLPHHRVAGRQVKNLYRQRMQVEETFRDMKNHRWGFGLRYARSNSGKRLEVLLLISSLASLVLWLLGLHGERVGVMRHFQANTERKRRVLSTVFLGQALLQRGMLIPSAQQTDCDMSTVARKLEETEQLKLQQLIK